MKMDINNLPFHYRLYEWWFKFGLPKYHKRNNLIYNCIYRIWLKVGIYIGFVKKLQVEQKDSLANARKALEQAFTPQLKSMLKEKMNEGK